MTFGILALGFPVSEVLQVLQPLGARLWGLTVSLSSLFFPILMHSLGDVWHPGPGVPCFGGFGGFCSLWGLTVSLSSLFFPILMHSLGDVWHPVSEVLQPLGAHSLTFFPILPYLNAFLRWRLASWPWGSLFRSFCRFCSLWGLTVSLSSLFFPILMHSLGDVWHPGPVPQDRPTYANIGQHSSHTMGLHSWAPGRL